MKTHAKPKKNQTDSSLLKRRVVKEADKIKKKEALILVAGKILAKKDFNDLSMSEIATSANIAKGTLYLYFKTKEELALQVLAHEYQVWFEAFNNYINRTTKIEGDKLAKWISGSLKENPLFLKLIPLGPNIFESNVAYEYLVEYKKGLHELLELTGKNIRARTQFMTTENVAEMLIQIHVQIIGLVSYGFPSSEVIRAIQNEKLHLLEIDFFSQLEKNCRMIFQYYFRTS